MGKELKQHEDDFLHIRKKHLVITALIIYFIFNMTCTFATIKVHVPGTIINWFEFFNTMFSVIGAVFMPFIFYDLIYGEFK